MKIGKYKLRKPWVKYVEVPLEKRVYWGIRKSILEDLLKEANERDCND